MVNHVNAGSEFSAHTARSISQDDQRIMTGHAKSLETRQDTIATRHNERSKNSRTELCAIAV